MRPILVMLSITVTALSLQADDKPNIIMILADDMGYNDCGFMGGTEINTPNLDQLAKQGAILDAFYVQPVCSPTRAAFMTGRYPMRMGLQEGVIRPWADYGLPLEEQTLAQGLQSAGYVTTVVGKWHLGEVKPEYLPTHRGYDHHYGHYLGAIDYNTHMRDGGLDWHRDGKANYDKGYSTHLIGDDAARTVTMFAGKKPFFLYVPFNAVHTPLQVPKKYTQAYANLKGKRQTYAGMLTALDENVGKIVAALDKAGIRDNTLFIFSSDNGGFNPGNVTDNGTLRAGKGTVYEGGTRVAAFMTWKGHIQPGTHITEPMHMVDLYPTLLNLVGANVEQKLPLDGKDVWPTITEGKPTPHDEILMNIGANASALRVGDWKIVKTEKPKKTNYELFNLKNDRSEKNDLSKSNTAKLNELQQRLAVYEKATVPAKNKPQPKGFQSPKVWGERGN